MFALLLGLALITDAHAEEPTVSVGDDGTVEARMLLPEGTGGEIRRVVGDTRALATLSPDVLSVETQPRGECEEVTRSTRGMLRPFRLRSLRCPTAQGWKESLIEQGDFTEYATEWRIVETAAGTEVVYRVRTALDIAVPEAVIRRTVAQSARDQLLKLARRVLGN